MLEPVVYAIGLALFAFTVLATARMQHDVMLVACIPPVFVALVMGFAMAIYVGDTYGVAVPILALVPAALGAWQLPKYYAARDQLIAIYLAWVVGMVFALIGIGMPDAV